MLHPVQDSGSLAVFKVTARDQGHYKGPSGAFVTYCNISCLVICQLEKEPLKGFANVQEIFSKTISLVIDVQ